MTHAHTAPGTAVQELVQRAKALRKIFAITSAQVDARGEHPTENLLQVGKAGLYRLSIPQAYGGLWDGKVGSESAAFAEVANQLSAGEGSTGMIFVISSGVLRMIFDEHSEAPEATRQQVAREVLEEHIIIVGSHAEAGIAGHVTSRKVDGGIVVNGTKSFNSGSGGARYAHVLHTLEGEQGLHIALIPLIAPGVRLHHDWDNMGQRATVSQKITYQDTFVPDDWHWHIEFDPLLPLLSYVTNASITLGIGEGGFDAMLDYVRTMKRTLTPGWTDGSTDPLVRLRIGELSAQLAAAHALMREVSSSLELLEEGDDLRPPLAATMRTHAICAEAAVTTANRLFELTGARSTANTYRLDRFWRNARTFSVHDPLEAKLNMVGGYELNGELALPFPPRSKK